MKLPTYYFLGLLLIILIPKNAFLQESADFEWVIRAGGSQHEYPNRITTDASGNIYIIGFFSHETTFEDTTIISSGRDDIFVAKLDPNGNFLWVKNIGGTSDDVGYGLSLDVSGNCYITGRFQNTVTFGTTTLTGSGGYDIFIAKLDPDGNFLWAKKAGGANTDEGWNIAVDDSGNCYVSGWFEGTASFGSHSITSAGGLDIFIVKLNNNGNFIWARRAGGLDRDQGWGIALDASGNIYVSGDFVGTASFGSHSITGTGPNIFIAKLSSNGNFLWARKGGSLGGDQGRSIAVDSIGNCYVTGWFQGSTAVFGSETFTNLGITDVFISKLDANGNFLWTKSAGGSSWDNGFGISIDKEGNSYVTGRFSGTSTFGSTPITSAGDQDIFITKLDANGNFLWTERAGGTGLDESYSIAMNASGSFYITGLFGATASFGSHSIVSNGYTDIFVAKVGVFTPVTHTSWETACDSFTWLGGNGRNYTSDTTVIYTFVNGAANGRDSVVILNLTINQSTTHTITTTACESYTLNTQSYTSSGTYIQTFTNTNNCDSIITLNLTIYNLDNTISTDGITLTANQEEATYQWIDCEDNSSSILGETSQSFLPTENGIYAVEVKANGCTTISDCIVVNTVGIQPSKQNNFVIHPNPANTSFTISGAPEGAILTITDLAGKLVHSSTILKEENIIESTVFYNGIYFININTNGINKTEKVVINR